MGRPKSTPSKSSIRRAPPPTKDNKKAQPKKKEIPRPVQEDNEWTPSKVSPEQRRHQQLALNIFRDTFASVLSSDTFTTTLQTIKQALFERDFTSAFEDPDSLAVYAARWSPTRALCYASILSNLYNQAHLEEIISPITTTTTTTTTTTAHPDSEPGKNSEEDQAAPPTIPKKPTDVLKILSIGGGAAELVAFGSFLGQTNHNNHDPQASLAGEITLVDCGPWGGVVSQLETTLKTPPTLHKYASQTLKDANRAMISSPDLLASRFLQQDALALDRDALSDLVPQAPVLATLLFTLNELFTTSGIGRTTAFLLNMTAVLPVGSLLLVVDSPGSYSETGVGGNSKKQPAAAKEDGGDGGDDENSSTRETKKYPMQWLLDKILLSTEHDPVEGRAWAKLESHDSLWFRLAEQDSAGSGLDYPIPLENMRYQMHMYRLVDAASLD